MGLLSRKGTLVSEQEKAVGLSPAQGHQQLAQVGLKSQRQSTPDQVLVNHQTLAAERQLQPELIEECIPHVGTAHTSRCLSA